MAKGYDGPCLSIGKNNHFEFELRIDKFNPKVGSFFSVENLRFKRKDVEGSYRKRLCRLSKPSVQRLADSLYEAGIIPSQLHNKVKIPKPKIHQAPAYCSKYRNG